MLVVSGVLIIIKSSNKQSSGNIYCNYSLLRWFIGTISSFNVLSFIIYGLSAISLFVIVVTIYLIPSDTVIIPIQTPLEKQIGFLEECISENKHSVTLNGTNPNQFCMKTYKLHHEF